MLSIFKKVLISLILFFVFGFSLFYHFGEPYRLFVNKGGYLVSVKIDKINRDRIKTFDFSISSNVVKLNGTYHIKGNRIEGDSVILLIVNKGDFIRMVNDHPSSNQSEMFAEPMFVDTSSFAWESLLY